jgi:hypothetical protein
VTGGNVTGGNVTAGTTIGAGVTGAGVAATKVEVGAPTAAEGIAVARLGGVVGVDTATSAAGTAATPPSRVVVGAAQPAVAASAIKQQPRPTHPISPKGARLRWIR